METPKYTWFGIVFVVNSSKIAVTLSQKAEKLPALVISLGLSFTLVPMSVNFACQFR